MQDSRVFSSYRLSLVVVILQELNVFFPQITALLFRLQYDEFVIQFYFQIVCHKSFVYIWYSFSGPKAFPLDRLMAIFFSMVEVDIDPNANLLMQVSSLVSLNLLAKVSADDQIDLAKYKCLVSLDFVQSLADNLELNLAEYLLDS